MEQKKQYRDIVIVAAAIVIGVAGLRFAQAADDTQSTPAQDEPAKPAVKVPSSNPLSGNPEAIDLGKRLYFTWCVQCHGPKAGGNPGRVFRARRRDVHDAEREHLRMHIPGGL